MKLDPENSPFNLIDRTQFLNMSAALEFFIALIALFLGWWLEIPLLENLHWDWNAAMWGVLSVIPLLVYFFLSTNSNVKIFVEIKEFLIGHIGPVLSKCKWSELFGLSLVIGFSEELLFRGVIQFWLTRYGIVLAIFISNLIFSLLHSLSASYILVTFLIGIYLGSSLYLTENQNLLVPMISHALYDFVAFLMIRKMFLERETEPGETENSL